MNVERKVAAAIMRCQVIYGAPVRRVYISEDLWDEWRAWEESNTEPSPTGRLAGEVSSFARIDFYCSEKVPPGGVEALPGGVHIGCGPQDFLEKAQAMKRALGVPRRLLGRGS